MFVLKDEFYKTYFINKNLQNCGNPNYHRIYTRVSNRSRVNNNYIKRNISLHSQCNYASYHELNLGHFKKKKKERKKNPLGILIMKNRFKKKNPKIPNQMQGHETNFLLGRA